jgi:peptidyl-prolyl cis-trans isomerase B (cyclophilin B)
VTREGHDPRIVTVPRRPFTPATAKDSIMVELHTNHGVIKLELNAEKAPKTVANFLEYVKKGHYDGTVFHRVIDGFMIQGGGFEAGMKQKPTDATIENEANNGLKNERGSIAMARTNDPHSASAQFFINVADNDFLNHTSPTPQGWGYAVFGKVVEGQDVVDKIKKVRTGSKGFHQDVPMDDVVIEKAVIVE